MATREDVITIARNYLRDHPKFFQTSFTPAGRTYDLRRPNVDATSVWVATVTGASVAALVPTTDYVLDERNGLLRLTTLPTADSVLVEGYHYEWLLPSDLEFYADMAIHLNTHNISVPLSHMAPAVVDVVGIHALIQALWGLLSEYSRDIDVITSESIHIIASQRYRMVSDLLDTWTAEYNKRASALNMGLNRIEVLNLRRVSKTTNRLVPLYKEREVGDYGPIERIWTGVSEGMIHLDEQGDELRQDILVEGEPAPGYLTTGYY